MKTLLVLGAGTAGSMLANKLVRALPPGWEVAVVDPDEAHLYQPGLLLLPFGTYRPEQLVKPRAALLDPRVRLVRGAVGSVDPAAKRVTLADGASLAWDVLVVATGAHPRPERLPGLTGRWWNVDAFSFYTLAGAQALAARLATFRSGHLVVHLHDLPIKCPVAPMEFTFLADAWRTGLGLRDAVRITFVTPLDGPFTKPAASAALGRLMAERGIAVEAEFAAERVDEDAKALVSFDGRRVPFDLLVTTPIHTGADALAGSGLVDDLGYVRVDRHTLQSVDHPDVFALGDAANCPTSKAGAAAHFQGEVLLGNLLRHVEGRPLDPAYDGHANCFIETGFGEAMLIDFSYDEEPLPGRFPLPGVGPLPLLAPSTLNHAGKLAFKWMYWNLLVRGRELPFETRHAPLRS